MIYTMNSVSTPSPADRLALIVRFMTADVFGRSSVLPHLLVATICMRFSGIAQRFRALALRVQLGKIRPRGERTAPTDGARPPRAASGVPVVEQVILPRGFAWLLKLVPGAANYGGQLVHFLEDPEVAALVASSPGFGRILRPMCRMLAVSPLPPILKPPPRARRAKPVPTLPAEPAATASPATPAPRAFPPMRPIYPKTGVFGGVEGWPRRARGGFSSA